MTPRSAQWSNPVCITTAQQYSTRQIVVPADLPGVLLHVCLENIYSVLITLRDGQLLMRLTTSSNVFGFASALMCTCIGPLWALIARCNNTKDYSPPYVLLHLAMSAHTYCAIYNQRLNALDMLASAVPYKLLIPFTCISLASCILDGNNRLQSIRT